MQFINYKKAHSHGKDIEVFLPGQNAKIQVLSWKRRAYGHLGYDIWSPWAWKQWEVKVWGVGGSGGG